MNTIVSEKPENIWMRGVYILLFSFIYSAAKMALIAVVVIQFMFILFTQEKNEKVLVFGADLTEFLYQIFRYVTFNSDVRPFPFNEWPKGKVGSEREST